MKKIFVLVVSLFIIGALFVAGLAAAAVAAIALPLYAIFIKKKNPEVSRNYESKQDFTQFDGKSIDAEFTRVEEKIEEKQQ